MNTTEAILEVLREKSVRLEDGLSESELIRDEEIYGFHFPPDLRELLGAALPLDNLSSKPQRFPNWRETPNNFIQDYLDWPLKGVLFDVERNGFWFDTWGERPPDVREALDVARHKFSQVPKLIPIWAHRFLPSEPCKKGNPIFSVYQTDVIGYGRDLLSYFEYEFLKISHCGEDLAPERRIPFWSELGKNS